MSDNMPGFSMPSPRDPDVPQATRLAYAEQEIQELRGSLEAWGTVLRDATEELGMEDDPVRRIAFLYQIMMGDADDPRFPATETLVALIATAVHEMNYPREKMPDDLV